MTAPTWPLGAARPYGRPHWASGCILWCNHLVIHSFIKNNFLFIFFSQMSFLDCTFSIVFLRNQISCEKIVLIEKWSRGNSQTCQGVPRIARLCSQHLWPHVMYDLWYAKLMHVIKISSVWEIITWLCNLQTPLLGFGHPKINHFAEFSMPPNSTSVEEKVGRSPDG